MKFQPVIKWTGSKRSLSEDIIKYFPKEIDTYYEPFCGGCSMLFRLLHSDIKVNKYICSDVNEELISFFNLVKDKPLKIYIEYKIRWETMKELETVAEKKEFYYFIRERYNKTHNIYDFVFLTRTAVNGLIRYNSKGEFNSAFHMTRDGIKPDNFKNIIMQWSEALNKNNVTFIKQSYDEIKPKENDFIFLDPPYIHTKGMYYGVIDFEKFWDWMRGQECRYLLTFDGKTTNTDKTYGVPSDLYTQHVYMAGKISGFKKLHSDVEYVSESLYIK